MIKKEKKKGGGGGGSVCVCLRERGGGGVLMHCQPRRSCKGETPFMRSHVKLWFTVRIVRAHFMFGRRLGAEENKTESTKK